MVHDGARSGPGLVYGGRVREMLSNVPKDGVRIWIALLDSNLSPVQCKFQLPGSPQRNGDRSSDRRGGGQKLSRI